MHLSTGKPHEAFRGLRVREVARHCRHLLSSHFLVDAKSLFDRPVNAEQTARTVNCAQAIVLLEGGNDGCTVFYGESVTFKR